MTKRPTVEEITRLLDKANDRGIVERYEVLVHVKGVEHSMTFMDYINYCEWDDVVLLRQATGYPYCTFTIRPSDYMQVDYSSDEGTVTIELYAGNKDFDTTINVYYKQEK